MPVLPANAAKGVGDLSDTTWLFREQLSLPVWTGSLASVLDVEVSFAFKDNPDFIFTDIYYNADTNKLHYVSEDAQSVYVYDFNSGSWVSDIFRDVGFTPVQSTNSDFSLWVESNASLQSGDYTFLDPGDGTDPGTYETIIVLAGKVYTFISESSYPLVTCVITPDLTVLTDGTVFYEWYPIPSLKFLGFSLSANNWDDPDYRVEDEEFYFRGSDTTDILQLYACYAVGSDGTDSPSDSDSDLGDLTSLFGPIFQAVSAFFSLEFVPGFSFGRIFSIALVVGLLFFFLKFAK